jgi:hypothetical protein
MTTDTLIQPSFDEHGRCVPGALSNPVHAATRRYFLIETPTIDYAAIAARFHAAFGADKLISAAEFQTRAEKILAELKANPATEGLTRGVAVPFMLPKIAAGADIGATLENVFLPAIEAGYNVRYPDYDFVNHHQTGLAGKLSVAANTRHERLLQAAADEVVVGYYFPCLTEYSYAAAREKLQSLPQNVLLAGGYDTAAAFIACPDLLFRENGYPPLLWLSALDGEKENIGYHFEAYGYNLNFNRRAELGLVAEYWWHGVSVLG